MSVHRTIFTVTENIKKRSADSRSRYLDKIAKAFDNKPKRKALGCANIAHGYAACGIEDKNALRNGNGPNLGIITSFNDMLSAHQPFEHYPNLIR
jgi:phosphogluconate dehydratase